MRQIVLDTETTGLSPKQGHRIIEIGCVELKNRRLTSAQFHVYLQPERKVDPGAFAVHGISDAFLADKPLFQDVAADFLAFIEGAELIIHNAPFDVGFIEHELGLLAGRVRRLRTICQVTDTLPLARKLHPGQKNNLDALCKRYQIDNSARDKHGALLDAEILARVYIAMTGGQDTLFGDENQAQSAKPHDYTSTSKLASQHTLSVVAATAEELQAHEAMLLHMQKATAKKPLWLTEEEPA